MHQKEVVVTSLNGKLKETDFSRCKILQDPLLINHIVLFFRKNHFLLKPVNNVIGFFKSSGLNDFWISQYTKRKKTLEDRGPQVLTVMNLSGTFVVFLVGSSISFLFFVVEVLCFRIQRRQKCCKLSSK